MVPQFQAVKHLGAEYSPARIASYIVLRTTPENLTFLFVAGLLTPHNKQWADTELEASGFEVKPLRLRPERGSHKSAQGNALGRRRRVRLKP